MIKYIVFRLMMSRYIMGNKSTKKEKEEEGWERDTIDDFVDKIVKERDEIKPDGWKTRIISTMDGEVDPVPFDASMCLLDLFYSMAVISDDNDETVDINNMEHVDYVLTFADYICFSLAKGHPISKFENENERKMLAVSIFNMVRGMYIWVPFVEYKEVLQRLGNSFFTMLENLIEYDFEEDENKHYSVAIYVLSSTAFINKMINNPEITRCLKSFDPNYVTDIRDFLRSLNPELFDRASHMFVQQ